MLVVFLAEGVALAWWTLHPRQEELRRVDALLVLASNYDSASPAIRLAEQDVADLLIISVPKGATNELCENQPADPDVVCFDPVPVTTQGEAIVDSQLAREHGVRSLGVVTFDYHLERARFVVGRCWDGELRAYGFTPERGWGQRAYDLTYAMAAYGKAFLTRDCTQPIPRWLQTPLDAVKRMT